MRIFAMPLLLGVPALVGLLACEPAPDPAGHAVPPPAVSPAPAPSETEPRLPLPEPVSPGPAPSAAPVAPGGTDVWEAARARDVDFRAIGQEPSWHLELEEEREIRFVVNDERHVFSPVPRPSRGIESPSLFYAVRSDGKTLNLIIEQTPCEDTMSGERFPATVTVELNGETYRGCGRELGDG